MSNSLVLFYSWSGNTRQAAEMIAEKTGADLWEIKPEREYPSDYNAVLLQAKQEIQQKQYPALRPVELDWKAYDVIYLGTPNWWSTMAPPVASFLHGAMPTDKTIAPFCTHGGGGGGRIAREVRAYCIGCDVLPILAIHDGSGKQAEMQIDQWLERIGL